jgi:hypothetical protein
MMTGAAFRWYVALGLLALTLMSTGWGVELSTEQIHAAFVQPPADCKPHTRWWWMGNALRKEDISWQLEQMQSQGIGGVEQVSMEPVYQKGNHEYLSPEYFELLRYAVEEAQARGMEFSINFGGPGWIWGGTWIPKEDQSKVLLASMMRVDGPSTYAGPLYEKATPNPRDLPRSTAVIAPEDRLVKVVAARLDGGRLRADSLIDLSALAKGRDIAWDVPEGQWQLMAFWLTQRGNADAVDHLNQGAMARYCERLGEKYASASGDHFGATVDSFFGDSFEVPIYRNGLYWSDGLFEIFQEKKGYDLVPWLPALWWEVDDLSPRLRYDVNQFLHAQGMTAFFRTFLDWCERHWVRGRIQPYGFVTDIIEGAGVSHLPEMEITAGEKDAVPWFDTRIGPKQYVASGAHLYGRPVVSAEAFTYLHWEPYRATLEELKIATDGYLCAGANKLYNHGYLASPERGIVPTRGFFAAIRISHENIWWPYYHHLAEYTARCCWLLRQGQFAADVAVYSPLANQWTDSVLNARKWTREFDWGGLGQLLISNGYGFDLVNDEMLQHHTSMDGAQLRVGKMTYRVLILPNIAALPVETLRQIEAYARQGGAVIALERIPEASTGMQDHAQNDVEARRIGAELFRQPGAADVRLQVYGQGKTRLLENVLHRYDQLDWHSAPLDPFLKTLRQCVAPDMDLDLVGAGLRNNEGLTHIHRRTDAMDIYFVSNLQYAPVNASAGFRVTSGQPYRWNPGTGERQPILSYARDEQYTRVRLSMEPFESRFIVFENTGETRELPHVVRSDFAGIVDANHEGFTALAGHNGPHAYQFFDGETIHSGSEAVKDLPAVYEVNGAWKVKFVGEGAPRDEFQWLSLRSWTDDDRLRHFSGTAHYAIVFDLPEEYCSPDTPLRLSLGVVGNIAEIRLNGKDVGVHWMNGQRFEVDGIAQPGRNTLIIEVTNTLINRVSGLDVFPEVPKDLQDYFGTGIARSNAEADKLRGFGPLPRSGLLGPVRITPFRQVRVAAPASNALSR